MAHEPQIKVPRDTKDTPTNVVTDDATETEAEAEETPKDTLEVEAEDQGTPMEVAKEGGTTDAGIDEDYVANVTTARGLGIHGRLQLRMTLLHLRMIQL